VVIPNCHRARSSAIEVSLREPKFYVL
jgi:hypothetical protein